MFLSLHFCPLGGVGSTRNWNFISFPWFHLIKTVYRKQSIWFIRVFFAENSCRLCLRMTILRVMRTNSNSFWAPKPKQRAESQHLQRVWPHSQMPYPPTATTLYCTLAVKNAVQRHILRARVSLCLRSGQPVLYLPQTPDNRGHVQGSLLQWGW